MANSPQLELSLPLPQKPKPVKRILLLIFAAIFVSVITFGLGSSFAKPKKQEYKIIKHERKLLWISENGDTTVLRDYSKLKTPIK